MEVNIERELNRLEKCIKVIQQLESLNEFNNVSTNRHVVIPRSKFSDLKDQTIPLLEEVVADIKDTLDNYSKKGD